MRIGFLRTYFAVSIKAGRPYFVDYDGTEITIRKLEKVVVSAGESKLLTSDSNMLLSDSNPQS